MKQLGSIGFKKQVYNVIGKINDHKYEHLIKKILRTETVNRNSSIAGLKPAEKARQMCISYINALVEDEGKTKKFGLLADYDTYSQKFFIYFCKLKDETPVPFYSVSVNCPHAEADATINTIQKLMQQYNDSLGMTKVLFIEEKSKIGFLYKKHSKDLAPESELSLENIKAKGGQVSAPPSFRKDPKASSGVSFDSNNLNEDNTLKFKENDNTSKTIKQFDHAPKAIKENSPVNDKSGSEKEDFINDMISVFPLLCTPAYNQDASTLFIPMVLTKLPHQLIEAVLLTSYHTQWFDQVDVKNQTPNTKRNHFNQTLQLFIERYKRNHPHITDTKIKNIERTASDMKKYPQKYVEFFEKFVDNYNVFDLIPARSIPDVASRSPEEINQIVRELKDKLDSAYKELGDNLASIWAGPQEITDNKSITKKGNIKERSVDLFRIITKSQEQLRKLSASNAEAEKLYRNVDYSNKYTEYSDKVSILDLGNSIQEMESKLSESMTDDKTAININTYKIQNLQKQIKANEQLLKKANDERIVVHEGGNQAIKTKLNDLELVSVFLFNVSTLATQLELVKQKNVATISMLDAINDCLQAIEMPDQETQTELFGYYENFFSDDNKRQIIQLNISKANEIIQKFNKQQEDLVDSNQNTLTIKDLAKHYSDSFGMLQQINKISVCFEKFKGNQNIDLATLSTLDEVKQTHIKSNTSLIQPISAKFEEFRQTAEEQLRSLANNSNISGNIKCKIKLLTSLKDFEVFTAPRHQSNFEQLCTGYFDLRNSILANTLSLIKDLEINSDNKTLANELSLLLIHTDSITFDEIMKRFKGK